jgi:hypothetical protein
MTFTDVSKPVVSLPALSVDFTFILVLRIPVRGRFIRPFDVARIPDNTNLFL